MDRTFRTTAFLVCLAAAPVPLSAAPDTTRIGTGTLIIAGGGYGAGVLEAFARLAGGRDAVVFYIPSASSGIRLPSGFIWSPPEEKDATHNTGAFEIELAALFRVGRVRVLHSRDRQDWEGALADSLRAASAVWLTEGNAGRLAGRTNRSSWPAGAIADSDGCPTSPSIRTSPKPNGRTT